MLTMLHSGCMTGSASESTAMVQVSLAGQQRLYNYSNAGNIAARCLAMKKQNFQGGMAGTEQQWPVRKAEVVKRLYTSACLPQAVMRPHSR